MRTTIPFEAEEQKRFRAFLKATGRKAGPYLRSEAMKRVEEWESITANNSQIDMEQIGARR